jgi:hypothetical protein
MIDGLVESVCPTCHNRAIFVTHTDNKKDVSGKWSCTICGWFGPPVELKTNQLSAVLMWTSTLTNGGIMNFGQAIEVLKSGGRVSRTGWNGKNMWLMLQRPDEHSKMSLPYIYMYTVDQKLVPWLASQTDVLAEDWGEIHVAE